MEEFGVRYFGRWYKFENAKAMYDAYQRVYRAIEPTTGPPKGLILSVIAENGTPVHLVVTPGVDLFFVGDLREQ